MIALLAAAALLLAPPAAPAPPARLLVTANEFNLVLSRPKIKAGRAIIELVNFGEDDHDLRLRRVGGRKVWGTPVVRPGGRAILHVTLPAGRYRVWCSVAGHHAAGMWAPLIVR